MLRFLNILFLMGVSVSFAQKKYVPFTIESAETKLIGEKVKVLDENLHGVYIPDQVSSVQAKVIIDQSGIYYLDDKMEKAAEIYNTSNADHILYKEENKHWLFKKNENDTYDLWVMSLSTREYKARHSHIEPVVMEEELVEELMDFYHEEKIKAKYKDGIVALKEMDEEMLVYVASNPNKIIFNTDPAFTVYIKSPECIDGHVVEKFEENQYDELTVSVKGELKNTGLLDKIVIDASGMYTCTSDRENKFYLFKPEDPNYILKKIDQYGYVALIKTENEFYHLLIYKPSNKQMNFSAIRESNDHGFYSDSEYRVDQGERIYLLCDIEKYLKFGIEKAGSYNGTRIHW